MIDNDVVVLEISSPVCVPRHALYANKKVLPKHLNMDAINNHFRFKTKNSSPEFFYVICASKNYEWAVRAVKIKKTIIFQMKR